MSLKMGRFSACSMMAILILFTFPMISFALESKGDEVTPMVLDLDAAKKFGRLALKGIHTEYPNKTGHVMNDAQDVHNPATLHPAFYGCFDWHSSVHGHWMLVRLLKKFPGMPDASKIREALNRNLTEANLRREADYFLQKNRKSFERTYGWAWLLKLAEEVHGWDDPDGKRWAAGLQPLVEVLVEKYIDFLPRQTYPIRRGVHPNTAFGISFALDYARTAGNERLEKLLVERSLSYFQGDKDYPARWEPDGDDFFSRSLMVADLMRRVLPEAEFASWLHAFLPGLAEGRPASLLNPAEVSDRSDPKIVHLDGLNLSRAWCMRSIASALPETDPVRGILQKSANLHANATLPHITSGNYEGEHWLASFAIYMLESP